MYSFASGELDEIVSAVAVAKTRGGDLSVVEKDDFPLPTLGPRLREIRREVIGGRGFVLFRGLPVKDWTIEETATAFWGLGRHFGDPVSQNGRGHLLGHVMDIGHDPTKPDTRLYATRARLAFHTDSCDIVGLACVRPAVEGGISLICSATTVFNELLAEDPDAVTTLMEPFDFDRKGEIPLGKQPFWRMPVFNFCDGLLTTYYAREFMTTAGRHEGARELTDRQLAAMDLLEAVAARPEIHLEMRLEAGDLQFIHNHQILHSRTEYQPAPDPAQGRHLLRLWLSASDGRQLPEVFAERYGSVEVGSVRGGIRIPGVTPHAPLQAK